MTIIRLSSCAMHCYWRRCLLSPCRGKANADRTCGDSKHFRSHPYTFSNHLVCRHLADTAERHWGPCFAGKIESNLHLPHMCDTWILRNTWVSSLHLSSEFWSRNMSTRGLRPFGGTTLNHHTDIGKLNTTPCRSTYRYLSCIYSIFGDLKDIRM